MPTSLFQYEMLPTTWFYVSTLIILAVFFKFNRFWSVRNLDLIGLILLTPGMLLLAMRDDQWGYIWFFAIGFLLCVRLIVDTIMVRRPLLEPNLTPGGLTFSCFFLVCFIIAALTLNRGNQVDTVQTVRLEQILTTRSLAKQKGLDPLTFRFSEQNLADLPPGFLPFHYFTDQMSLTLLPSPEIRRQILEASTYPITLPLMSIELPEPTAWHDTAREMVSDSTKDTGRASLLPTPTLLSEREDDVSSTILRVPDKTPDSSQTEDQSPALTNIASPSLAFLMLGMGSAMATHIMIVLAFLYIGHCHFGNIWTGVACATLYLLHPYTNQMVGRHDHLIPAALILWAVAMYRRPFFSGLWIGTAAALVFYPVFLVPLWMSFYWRRGWIRFLSGLGTVVLTFALLLLVSPASLGTYGSQLMHLFGKSSLWIFTRPDGFWSNGDWMMYRVPILAGFLVLCFGMILWPSRKHLATLLNCSALLMLSVQFWQLHEGGLFMAWYMPLLILTIFRPNLEDRIAQATVVT